MRYQNLILIANWLAGANSKSINIEQYAVLCQYLVGLGYTVVGKVQLA